MNFIISHREGNAMADKLAGLSSNCFVWLDISPRDVLAI